MDTVIKYSALNAMNKCTQNHMSCRNFPYHNALILMMIYVKGTFIGIDLHTEGEKG